MIFFKVYLSHLYLSYYFYPLGQKEKMNLQRPDHLLADTRSVKHPFRPILRHFTSPDRLGQSYWGERPKEKSKIVLMGLRWNFTFLCWLQSYVKKGAEDLRHIKYRPKQKQKLKRKITKKNNCLDQKKKMSHKYLYRGYLCGYMKCENYFLKKGLQAGHGGSQTSLTYIMKPCLY